jgi:hypothetical protein
MNNIWIYTIVFYVKKNDGISLREFMSFPFNSYEDAINFRKEYEKRENINKMFSKDYHWESILEEKEIK